MKKLLYLFLVLILVSCGSEKAANISTDSSKVALNAAKETSTEASSMKISAQSITSEMGKGKYKEGELLVKFKSGIVTTSSLKVHQTVGASVTRRFNVVPNLEHVKLPEGLSVKDAIIQYMSDPNVEYAEPNYIIRALDKKPNDTYFGNQWALLNTGSYANGTPGADISAPKAWDISTGSSSIVVAVLDTGIDYSHPDLVGNIWTNPLDTIKDPLNPADDDGNGFQDDYRGWNFVADLNNDGDCRDANEDITKCSDPMDDNGHGTHVAGIIGAVGDNGTGIAGVMWNVKLLPLKILGADGSGSTDDLIAAINYAVLLKNRGANIKVMNASIGTAAYSKAAEEAIAVAGAAGMLFVAAAGNGGGPLCGDGNANNNDLSPCYPASYNLFNIISVAATDQNDNRASFSNYGPTSVHVAAPGVYVLSTIPHDSYLDKDFNLGTSMAAPHVSGLAGLLYSTYPDFTFSQIRGMILKYVDTEKDSANLQTLKDWIYTKGRVNAYKALSSLQVPKNLTATPLSSTEISLSWTDNTGEDKYIIERKQSGSDFIKIDEVGQNITTYINSGLNPATTYSYRVKAYSSLPNPPGTPIDAESSWSNVITATTLSATVKESNGGGCSIGAKQNTPTAIADTAVMLIPLIFIAIMRRRR